MNLKTLSKYLMALAAIFMLASCAGTLKPLDARYVKVDPQPLVVKGGKVPASITIDVPAKWFNRNAEVRITPVLRYAGGEVWGTTYNFQGEKVRGNATTVAYNGGKLSLYSEFNYKPEMQKSELYLTFVSRIGNKEIKLAPVKIGEGVIATEQLASYKFVTPAIAPDKFQRIIKEKYDADIHFLIQQANLRAGELNKADVQEWKGIVKSADITPNQKVGVEVHSYASPDGGRELNEKLAAQREKNTSAYLKNQLKRDKIDAPVDAHYTAQDWEGFRELVEKSDIQDKDLVLRVLSMYPDPEVREREIKNISSVFKQLADEILPQLRRSRLIANVEIIGKSDDEIRQLAASTPNKLTVDELLYSATLTNDATQKQRIYTSATQIFPRDARAFNNLGMLAYEAGDYATAARYFANAKQVAQANNTDVREADLNLALIAMSEGRMSDAEQLLGNAGGVPELNESLGLLYIQQGKYDLAAKSLDGVNTNNAVIANILNRDYNKALNILSNVKKDATAYYLQAIIGARTSQTELVREGIQNAVRLDPGLAVTISRDREFAKYANQDFYKRLISAN